MPRPPAGSASQGAIPRPTPALPARLAAAPSAPARPRQRSSGSGRPGLTVTAQRCVGATSATARAGPESSSLSPLPSCTKTRPRSSGAASVAQEKTRSHPRAALSSWTRMDTTDSPGDPRSCRRGAGNGFTLDLEAREHRWVRVLSRREPSVLTRETRGPLLLRRPPVLAIPAHGAFSPERGGLLPE